MEMFNMAGPLLYPTLACTWCCAQALSDPATLNRLRPPGCESHPIVLDPCNLHVNVAAATPLPSLQALSILAERDLGVRTCRVPHRPAHCRACSGSRRS